MPRARIFILILNPVPKTESRYAKVTLVIVLIFTDVQPSVCLDKKIINTSIITRLGSYPKGKGKIRILQFKFRVAIVLRNFISQERMKGKGVSPHTGDPS